MSLSNFSLGGTANRDSPLLSTRQVTCMVSNNQGKQRLTIVQDWLEWRHQERLQQMQQQMQHEMQHQMEQMEQRMQQLAEQHTQQLAQQAQQHAAEIQTLRLENGSVMDETRSVITDAPTVRTTTLTGRLDDLNLQIGAADDATSVSFAPEGGFDLQTTVPRDPDLIDYSSHEE